MRGGINNQKGFTLVEIMMVVIIIGILAVLAIPRYEKYTIESKLSEVAVAVGELKTGQEKYYNSHGNRYAAPSDSDADAKMHEAIERTLRIDLGGGENFLFKLHTMSAEGHTGYVVIARLSQTGQQDNYQSCDLGDRVVFYFPKEMNSLYTSEAWAKGWNDDDFFMPGQSTADGMDAAYLN